MNINTGCPYLANVHCRRAKSLNSDHPDIQAILQFLDEWEVKYTSQVSKKTIDVMKVIYMYQ